ncbi:MAG TPA: hypothetical protein VMF06_07915 [Candidatus Limnocylindria bacterium]|jgi:hypothetical protein|nr:hypothetical protein [Candidatus Limnocylindria bacterium]
MSTFVANQKKAIRHGMGALVFGSQGDTARSLAMRFVSEPTEFSTFANRPRCRWEFGIQTGKDDFPVNPFAFAEFPARVRTF